MSEIVPTDEIEAIVGVKRHQSQHWVRLVSVEQRIYLMHSKGCLADTVSADPTIQRDLRDCPYSLALDNSDIDGSTWPEDVPLHVSVGITDGKWRLYQVEDQ